jgi:hypothetical protein
MKRTSIKKNLALVAISALAGVVLAPTADAATKSITCYKGTATKIVKGANPKCPAGYTTTMPAAAAAPASKGGVVAISTTYKGKIAMLWSDSGVTATNITAASSGNNGGLDSLSGTGGSSPQSKCDLIQGSGTMSGGGDTLKVEFDSSSKGCAEDESGPTTVTITGTAVIKGGTGKYAGATGTLKVTGSFAIKSTAAGTKDNSDLVLNISGNIVTK